MEVKDHLHTPTAIPSSSLSRHIILMILDSKFRVPSTSLFYLLSQLNGRELLIGKVEMLLVFGILYVSNFRTRCQITLLRLDISRGCLVSFVGGEKLMTERENNLYGSEAPDGWHSYWSAGDLSLSRAVFLLRHFRWRLTWLSQYRMAQSKHRVTRSAVWQWVSLPRMCVLIFNLRVTENSIGTALYPRKFAITQSSLWIVRPSVKVARAFLNFVSFEIVHTPEI